jgi:hypothetical protein
MSLGDIGSAITATLAGTNAIASFLLRFRKYPILWQNSILLRQVDERGVYGAEKSRPYSHRRSAGQPAIQRQAGAVED